MPRKFTRRIVFLLTLVLIVSQVLISPGSAQAKKDKGHNHTDLIIMQNVPEAKTDIEDGTIQLHALHVYDDGHFMKTSDKLTWRSSNKNVATVDENGNVTLSGQPGRTFIYVSDGEDRDRIAIHTSKSPKVIKAEGVKYDIIQNAINGMTLEEKVGQMLMPDYRKWNAENVTEMLPEIEQQVKDYHLGGVILFRENVVTTEQTAKLVSDYQKASEKYGLLMTIDQEGGIVTRLQSGTDMPGNMALGAARSEEISNDVGRVIGEELESLGINMNLAPVMDVNNNPDNPVIGVRSFGEDPELVAGHAIAYTKGLQETGVAATAKHFPGHGDTAVDSHLGLPEVPHDKERLKKVELYPFQQAMDAGIDAVMTAHVTFPKIDDTKVISKKDGEEISLPATLSEKVLTGLMREEMGHDGVIITDAMNMGAIVEHFGSVDAAIRAVKAGTDIVLMPVGLPEVASGLLDAVRSREISEERIEESVERILTLKVKRGIIKSESKENVEDKIQEALKTVGSDEHKAVEKAAAEKSITLIKNEDVLPLTKQSDERIVVIGRSFVDSLGEAVKTYHPNTTVISLDSNYKLNEDQREVVESADRIIVGTYTYSVGTRSEEHPQMKMVNDLLKTTDASVIGVGIRNPYDIMAYPEIDGYIAQYGFRTASFKATAATIFGEYAPSGKLPVTIPGVENEVLYPFGHGLTY
ncbi:glycoside hydrolase family 3 protein [Guptibacillus algicola]|uniref:glycoside hydrolase family 3 protein n=1 Tax=Guptibacillus algicola TaxID=225844 RepID=UPI001CD2991F|nr:glycoside hydrolase family 3 protein [Alkalihalobacillus algicola]MCA0986932.1 glycoside hydrolase family 3 protein [Alkalihalobacillus algicola]